MKPVPKTIWITKYALTRGILKYDETSPATVQYDERDDSVSIKEPGCLPCYFHERGKDWYDNFEDAKKEANKMRLRKIENLKKQIAKLENLTFDENM